MRSQDSSLLIASRLYRVPARSAVPQATFDVDEDPQGIEWEQWGEEPTIELAECALRFNGEQMSKSCALSNEGVLHPAPRSPRTGHATTTPSQRSTRRRDGIRQCATESGRGPADTNDTWRAISRCVAPGLWGL